MSEYFQKKSRKKPIITQSVRSTSTEIKVQVFSEQGQNEKDGVYNLNEGLYYWDVKAIFAGGNKFSELSEHSSFSISEIKEVDIKKVEIVPLKLDGDILQSEIEKGLRVFWNESEIIKKYQIKMNEIDKTIGTYHWELPKDLKAGAYVLDVIPLHTDEDGNEKLLTDKKGSIEFSIEEQNPEELTPDEEQNPEELTPDEEQNPGELTPDEEQSPEELTPDEEQSPEELTPDEEQSPEELIPDEEQSPEELTPDEGDD